MIDSVALSAGTSSAVTASQLPTLSSNAQLGWGTALNGGGAAPVVGGTGPIAWGKNLAKPEAMFRKLEKQILSSNQNISAEALSHLHVLAASHAVGNVSQAIRDLLRLS